MLSQAVNFFLEYFTFSITAGSRKEKLLSAPGFLVLPLKQRIDSNIEMFLLSWPTHPEVHSLCLKVKGEMLRESAEEGVLFVCAVTSGDRAECVWCHLCTSQAAAALAPLSHPRTQPGGTRSAGAQGAAGTHSRNVGVVKGANPSPPPPARACEILCHPSREQHHFPFTAKVSFVTPMGNNKQDSSTSSVSPLCACRAQSLISVVRGKGDGTHLDSWGIPVWKRWQASLTVRSRL